MSRAQHDRASCRRFLEGLGESAACRTVANNRMDTVARGGHERGEVGALVVSTKKHDETRSGKRRERFERRIDVCRFRVIEEANAAHVAAGFDAMLERCERAQAAGHIVRIDAERESGRCGGERIGNVVFAPDQKLISFEQHMLDAVERDAQHAFAVQKRRIIAAACSAHVAAQPFSRAERHIGEGTRIGFEGAQAAHLGPHNVVGCIEHGYGPRSAGQVREHLALRVAVSLKRPMPVQVVRRDIEQHGHIRREVLRGGKLVR